MRVHVVHAHPVETSFSRTLFETTIAALKEAGHEVDPCNLYDEGFEAVMSREERLEYHEVPENITPAIAIAVPIWAIVAPRTVPREKSCRSSIGE